jgi:hypothetical protein
MSTVIKPVPWYRRVLRRYVRERLRETCDDLLIMLALLLALALMHQVTKYIPASPSFHRNFAVLHEWVTLFTYGIGAAKGLWRLIRLRR